MSTALDTAVMSLESELRALVAQLVREELAAAATAPSRIVRPPSAKPTWFDVEELSRYLDTPVNTLLHWRKNGQGPRHHKLGRRVRYSKADVDRWLESKLVGDASA